MTHPEWYQADQRHEELAILLKTSVLPVALEVLQHANRPRSIPSNDTTELALMHATHVGYQRALDDLARLALPATVRPKSLASREWKHAKPATDHPLQAE